MKRIAMLSTGYGVIPTMTRVARELDPKLHITHLLDDGVLTQVAAAGNRLSPACLTRLMHLARAAELGGAQALLITCSSVSEFADHARPFLSIPVYKIDEPMLRGAVERGTRIGVMATASTTLEPTLRQIERLAAQSGKRPLVEHRLEEAAFRAFSQGDVRLHNELVRGSILELCGCCDVVVLAQVSLASAAEELPDACRDKVLTSPRLGLVAALSRMKEV